ncbi:MAG: VWA domain-containing protein [Leptospiraceae bacterium]|nr:VWA domain-containing protein [Leptospiraceae bacterium]MCK6380061.1 VWA domain-containing protein [Leptospiraceae bacterium]NUM40654.1 VWA domain-containing protein [Leptospiraceae bacterium]
MFLDFFYSLRSRKIPVTTGELLDLLHVISKITKDNQTVNVNSFYYIARNCLIKNTKHFDDYDIVFSQILFPELSQDIQFKEKLEKWLKEAIENNLSDERKKNALKILPDDLISELEKRLKEQKERHDGGNHWIGTGGTSPFGHGGFNDSGIRIGGESKNRSAISVAGERRYRDYRTDETLGVRQIKSALKKLRALKREGKPKLSIDHTIRKTCDNAGDIEAVLRKSRKNNMKLLLLMDVGGSMSPYAARVNKIFSAAHQMNHFKEFHYYYFHNIIYDYVYKDATMRNRVSADSLLKKFRSNTRVIFVGDAYMAPYELFHKSQYFQDYFEFGKKGNQKTNMSGLERLIQLKKYFEKSIWLNPENTNYWNAPTVSAIHNEVPMFFLSLDGIEKGIKKLL